MGQLNKKSISSPSFEGPPKNDPGLLQLDNELRDLYSKPKEELRRRIMQAPDSESKQNLLALYEKEDKKPIEPPNMRANTQVIGSPSLGREVEQLMNIAPQLRGLVNTVRSGPNDKVFERLRGSNFKDDEYWKTNLMGNYYEPRKEITINPALTMAREDDNDDSERAATLAHEFGHAAGYGETRGLKNLEGVARMRDEYLRRRKLDPSRLLTK